MSNDKQEYIFGNSREAQIGGAVLVVVLMGLAILLYLTDSPIVQWMREDVGITSRRLTIMLLFVGEFFIFVLLFFGGKALLKALRR